MILLLGHNGYVGSAFATELNRRKLDWRVLALPRTGPNTYDTSETAIRSMLLACDADIVINCAGYAGKPNVDQCENNKLATLEGNVYLPHRLARVCGDTGVKLGHISSGCIYSGGKTRLTPYPKSPIVHVPGLIESKWSIYKYGNIEMFGFTEDDRPNFAFGSRCSFYSGSKALGEDVVRDSCDAYIWRLRIPFNQYDGPRNYLSKLQRYSKLYDNVNSMSHLNDFVNACLDTYVGNVPTGTYNIVNDGYVSTREVVELLSKKFPKQYEYWRDDEEFYANAASTPRSNCILDISKLKSSGIKMRPVIEAIQDALDNWVAE